MQPLDTGMWKRTTRRRVVGAVAGAVCTLIATMGRPQPSLAQSANGATCLLQEAPSAGGGSTAGATRLRSVFAEAWGGRMATSAKTLRGGFQSAAPWQRPGTRLITVDGTIAGPAVSVTVNGIAASLTGSTYRAQNVPIAEGPNLLTATARDASGATATATITVHLDTRPPARPTTSGWLTLSPGSSFTLTGEKAANTSVWINGAQAVAFNNLSTWSATVTLTEGDNVFAVTTKDAAGNTSTAATTTIVLDNLPPVLTVSSATKTNLSPFSVTGTVDDSLTAVTVNGQTANRAGKAFNAPIPLVVGSNTGTVLATSPNNRTTTKSVTIVRGRAPSVATLGPADGSKPVSGSAVALSATASDPENDPIQYQFLLDGQALTGWQTGAGFTWTPTDAQTGVRLLEVRAQDGFGGFGSRTSELYIVYKPMSPQ